MEILALMSRRCLFPDPLGCVCYLFRQHILNFGGSAPVGALSSLQMTPWANSHPPGKDLPIPSAKLASTIGSPAMQVEVISTFEVPLGEGFSPQRCLGIAGRDRNRQDKYQPCKSPLL